MKNKVVPHVICMCGKRGFADEDAAEKALGRARARRMRSVSGQSLRGLKIENRFYECPKSGLFHLTEQSRRVHELHIARYEKEAAA